MSRRSACGPRQQVLSRDQAARLTRWLLLGLIGAGCPATVSGLTQAAGAGAETTDEPAGAPAEEAAQSPGDSQWTDVVSVRVPGSLSTVRVDGVIEDLRGLTVVVRRSGGKVEIVDLREVTEFSWPRSRQFEEGWNQLMAREWKPALRTLTEAEHLESRAWVRLEIAGARARAQRALGQYEECLRTVEAILREDPLTRHVLELPFVWDERLPVGDRPPWPREDLNSESSVRQLLAASARLDDVTDGPKAESVLQSLRKIGRGQIQELAEMQLWRVRLLRPGELRDSEILRWQDRARKMVARTRAPGEFVIGRGLMLLQDYDRAAASLLWMPLVEPLDPATTTASLADAITALELSGRTDEALRLRADLANWLPTP